MNDICVLIPCKDDIQALQRTLSCMHEEPGLNVAVLVCDDGSSHAIQNYSLQCVWPVTVIRNTCNQGIAFSLNRLLDLAEAGSYSFAARIDAGDLMLPGRLEAQVRYLIENPEVVVVGGGMSIETVHGQSLGSYLPPISASSLHRSFRFGFPIAHPTVMFRLSSTRLNNIRYRTTYRYAEDYDLFYSLHLLNPRSVANVDRNLTIYVRDRGSIGISKARSQAIDVLRIRWRSFDFTFWSLIGLFDPKVLFRIIHPQAWNVVSSLLKRLF